MSDFDKLAGELLAAGPKVIAGSRAVVQKGALNVKNDFDDSLSESPYFKGVGGSVTFDTKVTSDGVEAEIGPDKSRHWGTPGPGKSRPAAPLANIAIFGGAHGGGTVPDPQKHLDTEAPKFEAAMNALLGKALP